MNLVNWIIFLHLLVLQIECLFLKNEKDVLEELFERGDNGTKFERILKKFLDGDTTCLDSLVNIGQTALKSFSNYTETFGSSFEYNWAVRLIDALPTKPPGLGRKGPFFFIGDFETCKELWSSEKHVKYCTVKGVVNFQNELSPVTAGVCVPSECKEHHIEKLFEFAKKKFLDGKMENTSIHCSDGKDETWKSKKTFVLFAVFFMIALLTVGTLIEKMDREGLIKKSGTKMRRMVHRKKFRVNSSLTGSMSDARSTGGKQSSGDENESTANLSVNRPYAPSIALTYRNLSSIHLSNSQLINILSSFSIRSSLNYLFRNSTRDVKLVNMFRVCSSFWVIFSHTCLFSLNFTDTVRSVARKGENVVGWRNFMLNSSLAVDSFLFLSGCVATYSIRKRLMFRGSDSKFPLIKCLSLFFHRCLRLLPALSLYLLFISTVYNHLSDGPFWNSQGMFGTECSATSLWPHFAFLANFFPSHCVPWLWYISLDFQLYLTIPIIIYFISKFRFGWLLVVVLCILSLTYRTLMYSIFTLPANMFVDMLSGNFEKAELSFKLLYTSPLSRYPPFLIGKNCVCTGNNFKIPGILTGWYTCQIRYLGTLRSITAIGLKIIAVSLLVIALFGPFFSWNWLIYTHSVTNRMIWSIGLAILVVLAQNEYNFGVFKVFGGHALVVLSRLSLGVYLSHEPILLFYLNSLRQPMSPNTFGYFMFITIAIYAMSLVSAFFIAITIEVPLLILERKLFMTTRSINEDELKDRMERHVSFGETEIEMIEENDDDEDSDDEMDPEEKTRQWLETGKLCAQRSDLDVLERQIKEEESAVKSSTSC
ncbi:hypothetical protein B9Z55_002404 [Caenorhabditis nigoni]|uniref:Nose resistant-to-fluoxetine protein N-terminal domain-containing protein n=1 Tax=Caenorhabditis nigoni TaxID=1611254 RepID=A0A2G5VKF1_9PELO|nr:hypothetical protein B9Z55_002404 [Caenorhabditis nigoni]